MSRKPSSRPRIKVRKIPHEFVLEILEELNPVTRAMFGAYAVYVEDGKLVLILRERESYPADNGVWVATRAEHHASLEKELPSMRGIGLFGSGPTHWRCLPSDSSEFETAVERVCELILARDERIGTYPKSKSRKKKSPSRKTT